MQAVQRTALSEIEKEEKTEAEREERENSGTKWLTTKFVSIGVSEKGNGSEEHVLLLESSRARNTEQTPQSATSASLVRLILSWVTQEHSLYSIDVKTLFFRYPKGTEQHANSQRNTLNFR